MTFKKDCVELFGTDDLYLILNLDKSNFTASIAKKAYYQRSILYHPDRFATENEQQKLEATRKFQIIGRAYCILSDSDRKSIYDATGCVDEEHDITADDDTDWSAVFRAMFKKVTKAEIDAYLKKFRGSAKEMEDVKQAYCKYKGDMDKVLQTVIGADANNEDRIREIIVYLIENGDVEPYPKFINEPPSKRIKRQKKAQKERIEAEKVQQSNDDLSSMILANREKRERQFDGFMAHLEEKYGESSKKKAKK